MNKHKKMKTQKNNY